MSGIAQRSSRRRAPNRKLQILRINEGLSPNALAYRAGVSGNTVRAAERGEWVSEHSQKAIAEVFAVDPIEIFPLETQRRFA